MKITLARLHIKNFRGYRDATIAFDENMNVIIGRNDIGKSTVLEALEIFFNNEQIKIDVGDKNIKSNDSEKIEISCSFSVDDDAKIIIDSSVPVDLGEEYLLNDNNELEINKVWDCSKKTIGAKDLKIFIKAKYPVLECGTLVGEKLSSLKSILKGCVSKEIYDEVDKTKSSEVRKAIYLSQVNADTSFVINDIDVTADGMKDIWKSLQGSLLELANDKKHQIIVTTHNPEVAKLVDLNQLIFIYRDNDGNPIFEEKADVKIPSIIETLGILPYAVEQCVICVEGENDVSFINNINKIDEFRRIVDLEALKIRIVPLQGSNLIRWVNENYFSESNIKI